MVHAEYRDLAAAGVSRIVEREVEVGYSLTDAIKRAAIELGITPSNAVRALKWHATHA